MSQDKARRDNWGEIGPLYSSRRQTDTISNEPNRYDEMLKRRPQKSPGPAAYSTCVNQQRTGMSFGHCFRNMKYDNSARGSDYDIRENMSKWPNAPCYSMCCNERQTSAWIERKDGPGPDNYWIENHTGIRAPAISFGGSRTYQYLNKKRVTNESSNENSDEEES